MSQKINHRRGEDRHQDNGPRWESHTPNAGSNSTHVARSRRSWRTLGRRMERRTGKHSKKIHYLVRGCGPQHLPEIDTDE